MFLELPKSKRSKSNPAKTKIKIAPNATFKSVFVFIYIKFPIIRIKEKIIGAVNSGIKKIYIPESNLSDLELIPEKILSNVDIIGVKSYNQIYKDVFKLW